MAKTCARKRPPCSANALQEERLCKAHHDAALKSVTKKLTDTCEKPDGEDGCWYWTGGTQQNGYGYMGTFGLTDNSKPVHWMALVAVGELAINSHGEVHHACGEKSCINPAHLMHVSTEFHELLHQLTNAKVASVVLDHFLKAYPEASAEINALRGRLPT